MSITVEIDESLLRAVEQATKITDPSKLILHLMERELRTRAAQQRLAAAGGSMPDREVPPRITATHQSHTRRS